MKSFYLLIIAILSLSITGIAQNSGQAVCGRNKNRSGRPAQSRVPQEEYSRGQPGMGDSLPKVLSGRSEEAGAIEMHSAE